MRPALLAALLAPAALLLPSPALAQAPRRVTLDEALEALRAHNPTLAQARAHADQARGVARQAAAPLLPTLGAQGSYVRNSHEATASFAGIFQTLEETLQSVAPFPIEIDTAGLPEDLVIQPLDALTVGASLRVPLVHAAGWEEHRAARRAAAAAEEGSAAAELQLTRAFVEACWLAGAAEEVVEAAGHATESARQHRDATARRAEAGLATRLEVLRAETELARREGDLAEARAGLERAQRALGALLGEATPVAVDLPGAGAAEASGAQAGGAEDGGAAAEEGLVEEARGARAELRARSAEVEARQAQVRAAGLRHLPTLAATGTAFASDEPYPTREEWGWKVGLELGWVAYDGGYRYGRAAEARAALAGARAGQEAAVLQVELEVRQALDDVEVAGERLRLAQAARDLAVEAEAAADRGYEAGLVASLEVLDAQDRLYAAEVGLAQARAGLGQARARLQAATGRGW